MTNNDNRLRIWTEQGNVHIPLLFFQYYKELGITDEEGIVITHLLAFQQQNIDFPTPGDLAARMKMQLNEISNQLQKLVQRGFLEITQGKDSNGKLTEKYSLYPLWDRIVQLVEMKTQNQFEQQQKKAEGEIFRLLEAEFGRLFSPMELETISMWIDVDHHSPEIIKLALKEAVLAGKLNLRYIDRILYEWKRKNIRTPQQIQQQAEQFRQHTMQKTDNQQTQSTASKAKVPFYNWLEERE